MRHLLVALPLSLLVAPLAHTLEHHPDGEAHSHASLHAHEHGVARLDVALEGKQLELEMHSPAINLLGFEHAPGTPTEKARVEAVRNLLEQPFALFGLPALAKCTAKHQAINSPLFDLEDVVAPAAAHADHHLTGDTAEPEHAEIEAHYRLECAQPEDMYGLDLSVLFRQFPDTHSIQVQLIGPHGQQGHELTRAQPRLPF